MRQIVATFNCLSLAVLSLGFVALQAQQPSAAVAATDKLPGFEVASIKPSKPDDESHGWTSGSDRVSIEDYTLRQLIRSAYGLKSDSQVLGGPYWIGKQAFDIQAKVSDAEVAKMQKMTGPEKLQEARLFTEDVCVACGRSGFRLSLRPRSRDLAS